MIRMIDPKVRRAVRPRIDAACVHSAHVMSASKAPEAAPAAPKEKYAPKSDAPYQSVARLLIGGVHFAVLIGIVALLVTYSTAALRSSKEMAVAKVVASNMPTVAAPYSGQFQAARAFSNGEWVRAGDPLGVVKTREIGDQLRGAKRRLSDLQREFLLASQAASTSSSESSEVHEQHLRQLRLDVNAVQSEIARLSELEQDLVVRSPVDGRIWFGLSGSKEVGKDQEIAAIWPEGGEVRIEIEAPLQYIDEILQGGTVECNFATPEGEKVVRARPIVSTRQMLLSESEENPGRKQVFGRIECIPDADASQSLVPGWIGSL